jgi:hypothetical protein
VETRFDVAAAPDSDSPNGRWACHRPVPLTAIVGLALRSRTRIAVWAVQHGLSPSGPD